MTTPGQKDAEAIEEVGLKSNICRLREIGARKLLSIILTARK
jgi:hypothetical protein